MSLFLYSCLRYPAFKSHLFRAVLYVISGLVWLYHIFPHYHVNSTILRIELLSIKCVFLFSLQLSSQIFLTPRRNKRDIIINLHSSSCKISVIRLTPRQIFKKIFRYQISRKSVKLEKSCFMQTDGRADMRKLTVAFRNFASAPKNQSKLGTYVTGLFRSRPSFAGNGVSKRSN